ncbi:MAG: FAD-dependent oxidoreductase [Halobacteriales archaeon SW_9_67_25]|jgi:sarcosine oxidase subunit beta|nr:MAG: FAD-dependent oxidoreductase [Halobacteriales archaeon SW_9_67_25]
MDAVVVGGGIIGVSSAYYLARRGVDVTVLERASVGAGNTGRANGGIRAQFSSPVSVALSNESIAVWEDFEEGFGVDIGYRRPGYMFLLREESTAEQFRENVTAQNRLGVPSEFLTPEEAAEHCPGLRAEQFCGATYSPTDGFADPNLALQGFVGAAREAGAAVRTDTEVTDVRTEGERVTGVETDAESVAADYVINAAGAWARRVGKMSGLDLPVSPRRRQLAVLDPATPVPGATPFVVDVDGDAHFRPERAGAVVAGGRFSEADPAVDPDTVDESTSLEWAAQVVESLADVADYFGPETRVRRGWAGVYAVTPDHHPIIEETRPGFVNAVGFSGHGFMQSPATGRIVAELVVDGEASLVDVSDLGADRFERGEHLHEGTVID